MDHHVRIAVVEVFGGIVNRIVLGTAQNIGAQMPTTHATDVPNQSPRFSVPAQNVRRCQHARDCADRDDAAAAAVSLHHRPASVASSAVH